MIYKILILSLFNLEHFITGYKNKPINYCIYCKEEFDFTKPCPKWKPIRKAIKFILEFRK